MATGGLPSLCRACCSGLCVAGDAMADAVDAAEFLAVDVDEFAQPLTLVAHQLGPFIGAFRRPRPIRRNTTPTVDTGSPNRRAIRGPLRR